MSPLVSGVKLLELVGRSVTLLVCAVRPLWVPERVFRRVPGEVLTLLCKETRLLLVLGAALEDGRFFPSGIFDSVVVELYS